MHTKQQQSPKTEPRVDISERVNALKSLSVHLLGSSEVWNSGTYEVDQRQRVDLLQLIIHYTASGDCFLETQTQQSADMFTFQAFWPVTAV